jgi:hypothetical protein
MRKKVIDLSAVFCSEPDKGQEIWDGLPQEFHLHFAQCFAAAAGLCPAPGEYQGPPVNIPEDEE